jgi:hypothetical protein
MIRTKSTTSKVYYSKKPGPNFARCFSKENKDNVKFTRLTQPKTMYLYAQCSPKVPRVETLSSSFREILSLYFNDVAYDIYDPLTTPI